MSEEQEPTYAELRGISQVSAGARDRRSLLEAILARLAQELDGLAGHRYGCECRCGVPPDSRTVPTLAAQIREIAKELDGLPVVQETVLDEVKRKREERRAATPPRSEASSGS